MTALARPLVAESIKLRRGSLPRLPLFGLLAALLEGTLCLISPYALHSWTALSAWHIVWVTFLSPLALALLAGLGAQREAHARWGGTLWRPVTPVALAGAQFLGLAALAFAMDLCVILGSLPFGVVARLPGAAPVAHGLALAIILWITSLPLLALFQLIATRWGLIPTMLAGLMGPYLGCFQQRATCGCSRRRRGPCAPRSRRLAHTPMDFHWRRTARCGGYLPGPRCYLRLP